jgi:hypothetical protein
MPGNAACYAPFCARITRFLARPVVINHKKRGKGKQTRQKAG